jgi:hypothetical protein
MNIHFAAGVLGKNFSGALFILGIPCPRIPLGQSQTSNYQPTL